MVSSICGSSIGYIYYYYYTIKSFVCHLNVVVALYVCSEEKGAQVL